MVLAGLLLMAYSDPAIMAGFGGTTGPTTISFTRSGIFTFTGTSSVPFNRTGTFPFNRTGGLPTRFTGGAISTTTQEEAFVGLGLVAIGLLLEAFTLLLWQTPADQKGLAQPPGQETQGVNQVR
jgi:hypothetical protein